MRRIQLLASVSFALSGCATLSFAPPQVRMDREVVASGNCTPNHADTNPLIRHDVDGALALINNFILIYQCQRDNAANGRQFFELPAFLGTAGAATAAALGAGPHVAIFAGAASATLDHTKQYYAPQDKAKVLSDGLKAILCVQARANGVDPYTLKTIAAAQTDNPPKAQRPSGPGVRVLGVGPNGQPITVAEPEPSVEVSDAVTYYNMIEGALIAVADVVGERLSHAGTPFDAKGVIAEIEKLNKKEETEATTPEAKDPGQTGQDAIDAVAPTQIVSTGPGGQRIATAVPTTNLSLSALRLAATPAGRVGTTVIKLNQLQTKLDQCIVQAKI